MISGSLFRLRQFLTLLVCVFVSGIGYAGYTQPFPVFIDFDSKVASGDMWTARSSSNVNELMGCGVRYWEDGGGGVLTSGFCQAQDAEGNEVFCETNNPDLLQALNAMSSYSFVTFSWVEGHPTNTCTRIGFSSQSFYLPKK